MVHSRRVVTVARRTSCGFQVPAEALNVGAANLEQAEGVRTTPGGELPQVERVRFPGQPAVAGQEAS